MSWFRSSFGRRTSLKEFQLTPDYGSFKFQKGNRRCAQVHSMSRIRQQGIVRTVNLSQALPNKNISRHFTGSTMMFVTEFDSRLPFANPILEDEDHPRLSQAFTCGYHCSHSKLNWWPHCQVYVLFPAKKKKKQKTQKVASYIVLSVSLLPPSLSPFLVQKISRRNCQNGREETDQVEKDKC